MAILFNDPACHRESNQWRSVYATPSVNENPTQLFANFGSSSEQIQQPTDFNTIVSKITNQFVMDVFNELRQDLAQAQSRSSRTSQGLRDQTGKSRTQPQRTPIINPRNNRRTVHRGSTPIRLE